MRQGQASRCRLQPCSRFLDLATPLQGLEACLLALIFCALWTRCTAAGTWGSAAAALSRASTGVRRRAAAVTCCGADRTRSARAGAARAFRWLVEPVAITRGQMLADCMAICILTIPWLVAAVDIFL